MDESCRGRWAKMERQTEVDLQESGPAWPGMGCSGLLAATRSSLSAGKESKGDGDGDGRRRDRRGLIPCGWRLQGSL